MRIRAQWILPLILAGLPGGAMPAVPVAHPAHASIAFPGYRSRVSGINNSGTAIGYYNWVDGTLHAFAYIDGKYRELKPPVADGSSLTLLALNNRNQVLMSQPSAGFFIYDIARATFFRVGQDALIAPGPGTATQEVFMDEITGLNDKGEILFRAGMYIGYGPPALGPAGSLSPQLQAGTFTVIPGCCEPLPGDPIAIDNKDEIFRHRGGQLSTGSTASKWSPLPIRRPSALRLPRLEALDSAGAAGGLEPL